jgi:hypothetical protein
MAMLTPLKNELTAASDLNHEARRFRTILKSFERNLDLLFRETNLAPHVDHAALAVAFSKWRQRFDATKYLATTDRRDFTIYSAGLMLKELIAADPLKALPRKGNLPAVAASHANHALARWPEGYAYTSFCLSVAAAILLEIGEDEPDPAKALDEPAFWSSFKENVAENPAAAIAFFDLVCGKEPNWDAPDVPALRKAFSRTQLLGETAPASVREQ